jgi:glutathione S-transferase
MKLYYLTGACSLAAHIALCEAAAKFDTASLDRQSRKTSDGEAFDQVNSKGYVPALRLDDGALLTEVVAVLQYIGDRYPAAKLVPAAGSMERYRQMEWLSFINSEMHKSCSPLFSPIANDDVKQFARDNLFKRTDWLERTLDANKYLMGEQFTVADAYLFTVLNWFGLRNIDLAKWPNLKRYHARVGARPQVQQALKAEGLLK